MYPSDPNQYKLVYNLIMFLGTVLTAAYFSAPLAFTVALVWSVFWFWDLYYRPHSRPDTEVPEEQVLEREFNAWWQGQLDERKSELAAVRAEVAALKERLGE